MVYFFLYISTLFICIKYSIPNIIKWLSINLPLWSTKHVDLKKTNLFWKRHWIIDKDLFVFPSNQKLHHTNIISHPSMNDSEIAPVSARKAIKFHLQICWRKLFESIRQTIRAPYPPSNKSINIKKKRASYTRSWIDCLIFVIFRIAARFYVYENVFANSP